MYVRYIHTVAPKTLSMRISNRNTYSTRIFKVKSDLCLVSENTKLLQNDIPLSKLRVKYFFLKYIFLYIFYLEVFYLLSTSFYFLIKYIIVRLTFENFLIKERRMFIISRKLR